MVPNEEIQENMPPKKPKLTPEEKKELRAKKRAEAKLRAAEHKKQLKRDYLLREIKYGDKTLQNYEKNWRQMLIDIAIPNMRNELEYAWNNFERVIDCKDFTIAILMEEIRAAEDQYNMNFKNHVENIDKLIDYFRYEYENLQDQYLKDIDELQNENDKEEKEMRLTSTENEEYLKTMLYGLEKELAEQEQVIQVEYFFKLDDEKSKMMNIVQKLRAILEQKHKQIWDETQDFLNRHYESTKERRNLHDNLKQQDDSLQELLTSQINKIYCYYNIIKKLKSKYSDLQRDLGDKIEELQYKQNFFHDAFFFLKDKLEKDRKLDEKQLSILTLKFKETYSHLQKIQTNGQHILHLLSICRKYETIKEKILPFPNTLPPELIQGKESIFEMEEEQSIDGLIPEMASFWQRLGVVEVSRNAIYEEMQFLKIENRLIKEKLHDYCKCFPCPGTESRPAPITDMAQTSFSVTDGNEFIKKYKKHNWHVRINEEPIEEDD